MTSFPIYFQHRTLAILGVKVEELYTRMFNHFPRNLIKIFRKRDSRSILQEWKQKKK